MGGRRGERAGKGGGNGGSGKERCTLAQGRVHTHPLVAGSAQGQTQGGRFWDWSGGAGARCRCRRGVQQQQQACRQGGRRPRQSGQQQQAGVWGVGGGGGGLRRERSGRGTHAAPHCVMPRPRGVGWDGGVLTRAYIYMRRPLQSALAVCWGISGLLCVGLGAEGVASHANAPATHRVQHATSHPQRHRPRAAAATRAHPQPALRAYGADGGGGGV